MCLLGEDRQPIGVWGSKQGSYLKLGAGDIVGSGVHLGNDDIVLVLELCTKLQSQQRKALAQLQCLRPQT